MLKTEHARWTIILLNFIVLSTFTLTVKTLGQEQDIHEDSFFNDIEMGTDKTKEMGKQTEIVVDFETKEQFKKEYLTRGTNKRELYDKYLPKLGSIWILNYLEDLHPRCHGQAHELGQTIYALSKDIGLALMECNTSCTSGCMHGILMEAFKESTLPELTNQMGNFCNNNEKMSKIHKPGNCAHGIGHALMVVTDYDIEKSIMACSSFSNPAMGYYCATGIFMEYLITGRKEDFSKRGLHFPCDKYTQYPAACYRYKIPYIHKEFKKNNEKLANECLELPKSLRLGCFHGLGKANTRAIFKNPKHLDEVCHYGTPDDQAVCIEGVIEKLAEYNEQKAISACNSLSGDRAKICLAAVKNKMYSLNKPTMELYLSGIKQK